MGPADNNNGAKGFVIPKLARDGSNWVTWKTQTLATLGSNKGVIRHLNGTVRVPDPLPTHVITESEDEAYDKAEKRWDDYYQREALIKAQIYTTIPEALLIEIRKLSTAKEIWDAICAKHEHTTLTVKIDIRRRMYEMKCDDDSNVRTHLEALMRMQEQLVGMEAGLTDDELITLILGSLPKSYRALINAISLSMRHAQIKLGPDAVIASLLEEFERLKIEERQLKASESALAATKGRGKGRRTGSNSKSKKSDIECWKCGKTGHVKADCNEKGKKKEDDDKKKESANATAEPDEWAFTTTFIGQASSQSPNSRRGSEVDVYDSGASSHMSPDRHRFTKFRETAPYPIAAADKAIFNATGIGDMRVAIPNGKVTNHITVKDVLYCKDLAFTLISLPKCDKAGFEVTLRDKHCTIRDPKGTTVGRIPLVGDLYKVEHNRPNGYATAARRTLSIDEVH